MLALAAAVLIAPVGGPVDATGSHLAYSRPEGGGYRLVIDGRDAPVGASPRPFDADLGTDARGRLVAVYSRTQDSRNVFWLDVGSGRERRVPAASRSDRDEGAASVSRGRVVFAVRARRRDRLFETRLTGAGVRPLPVPSATRPRCRDGRCRRFTVTETELAGGVLAFTAVEGDDVELSSAQLWFARAGRPPRLLIRRGSSVNQGSALLAPQVSSRWVSAGFNHVGDGGTYSRALRVSPARGTQQQATPPDVPDAVFRGAPQRELQGLGLGAQGAAYTSACVAADYAEPGTPPDCRLVRSSLEWRTQTG